MPERIEMIEIHHGSIGLGDDPAQSQGFAQGQRKTDRRRQKLQHNFAVVVQDALIAALGRQGERWTTHLGHVICIERLIGCATLRT
jgi:hypothetical protein